MVSYIILDIYYIYIYSMYVYICYHIIDPVYFIDLHSSRTTSVKLKRVICTPTEAESQDRSGPWVKTVEAWHVTTPLCYIAFLCRNANSDPTSKSITVLQWCHQLVGLTTELFDLQRLIVREIFVLMIHRMLQTWMFVMCGGLSYGAYRDLAARHHQWFLHLEGDSNSEQW